MSKKHRYFIIHPRSFSYTGFYKILDEGLRIANNYNYKKVICFPFTSFNKFHNKKIIYGKKLVFEIFNSLSFTEKVLTLFYTVILNINLLLKKIKILTFLGLITKPNLVKKIFPTHFGFNEDEEYFAANKETWKEINSNKNYFPIKLSSKKFLQKNSNHLENKFISMHIKDQNYNFVNEISNQSTSRIEDHQKAIEYFIDLNYSIVRIGDKFSEKFDFADNKFLDLTFNNNLSHYDQAYTMQNSEFFFGNVTPGVYMSRLFGKKFALTNCPQEDLIYNGFSNNYDNHAIFKDIFDVEQKRIISISELLKNEELLFMRRFDKKKFFLIDNTPGEILDLCKNFVKSNFQNIQEKNELLNEFNLLRKKNLDIYLSKKDKYNYLLLKQNYYSKISLPKKYLEERLYPNDTLIEKSKQIVKKLGL